MDDGSGHIRNVSVYALQRGAAGTTSTSDDCAIDAQPTRIEFNIPTTLFRKKSFYLDDRQVSAYMDDASAWVKKGTGLGDFPGFMQEFWDILVAQGNSLIADINSDLLTVQAASFGVNVNLASPTNAMQTINFNKNATVKDYMSGMTKVENDAMMNEFLIMNGTIVGAGMFNAIMLDQRRNAVGLGQNGINDGKLALPNYFFDPIAGSKWGDPDAFAVFDEDAVQLLEINRYKGSFGGDKGISWFGTISLPLVDSLGDSSVSGIEFDVQIKYIDCPTSLVINGASTTVNRGWQVILSKAFHQVNVPANSYTAGDRLYGNNGTLLYKATNASVS